MKTRDIKIAELKFFDKDHGIEVSGVQSYGLIAKIGRNSYLNILNPYDDYPIFERVPYSNCSRDGLEYGTKVISVGDAELESGPCWIIGGECLFDEIGKETIKGGDIEDFVLKSPLYYKDRLPLVKREMKRHIPFGKKFTDLYCLLCEDQVSKRQMDEFFYARCERKVNVKKDW